MNAKRLDSCVIVSVRLPGKHSVLAQMKAANQKNVVMINDLLIWAKNEVKSHPVSTYRDCSVARHSSCGMSHMSGSRLMASAGHKDLVAQVVLLLDLSQSSLLW